MEIRRAQQTESKERKLERKKETKKQRNQGSKIERKTERKNTSDLQFQDSGVIFVNRKAKFWGIGSGLLAVGNKRLVFKLLFASFFWTVSILSWLCATPAALGSASPGSKFFIAAISWSWAYFFLSSDKYSSAP